MNDAPRNPTSQVQVDISSVGVVATVTVTGVLDTTTATALTRHLLKVRTTHPERLVLDLAGLVFVGFAGVKALGRDMQTPGTPVPGHPAQPAALSPQSLRAGDLMSSCNVSHLAERFAF